MKYKLTRLRPFSFKPTINDLKGYDVVNHDVAARQRIGEVGLTIAICLLLTACGGGGESSKSSTPDNNACSVIGLSTRIINGTECSEINSPIVKLDLFTLGGSEATCSGALISNKWVLTAAHCFVFDSVIALDATVGGKVISGKQYIVHPDVRVDEQLLAVFNDVALVELAQTTTVSPLPLLTSVPVEKNEIIAIYGYGLDNTDNFGALNSGEMKIVNVTENHLFAEFGDKGSNTCKGDSGGPAVLQKQSGSLTITGIVGVVSAGTSETCEKGDISTFGNTQSHSILDFIRENVPGVAEV